MDILFIAFIAFASGRISHILAHRYKIQSVHHWIYGLLVSIIGIYLVSKNNEAAGVVIAFGIGLTISDLGDMIKLRFYGLEKFEKPKFWSIH